LSDFEERDRQMGEGPWLDRLFPVRLPGGRVTSVTAFTVVPANVGILEGGLSRQYNAIQREKIVAIATRNLGAPVVVVEPRIEPMGRDHVGRERERYPWMACMARLTSKPMDPEQTASELTVVWWQDAFDAPLPVEIERAVATIDWEAHAEDWEFS
jgi:hypothetical protein